MHNIEVPSELRGVDELIVPTSYQPRAPTKPAFAFYVVYLQAGLVEVLPQKWFTASQYRWESNGSRERHAIPSRTGFLASVLDRVVSCWRKMDAGWSAGWKRRFRIEDFRW